MPAGRFTPFEPEAPPREEHPNQPAQFPTSPDLPSAPVVYQRPPQAQAQFPTPTPAPKRETYQWDAPETVYHPEHPNYQPQMYMDRFREVLHNTLEHTGVTPNPNVIHDFIRSGLSIDAIRQVWADMLKRQPIPLAAGSRSPGIRHRNDGMTVPEQPLVNEDENYFATEEEPKAMHENRIAIRKFQEQQAAEAEKRREGIIPYEDLNRPPGIQVHPYGGWPEEYLYPQASTVQEVRASPAYQKLPKNLQFEIDRKPVIVSPAAPHNGIWFDMVRDAFIINPNNPAPPHVNQEQLIKAALHNQPETELMTILNLTRATRPDLVAQGLPMVDARDPAGAIARIAAKDPNIAYLISSRLHLDLPSAPYFVNQSEADKWQAALNEPSPSPGQFLGDILNLPPLKQYTDVLSALEEHTAYPLIQAYSKITRASPEQQIYQNLAEAEGAYQTVTAVHTTAQVIDPKKAAQLREEAAQLYLYLQEQGTNTIEIQGQKIALYDTDKSAGQMSYADWQEKNPSLALLVGLANPVAWIGPGAVIKAAKLGRVITSLPKFYTEAKQFSELSRLAREANAETKAIEAQKLVQTTMQDRTVFKEIGDRIGQRPVQATPLKAAAPADVIERMMGKPVEEAAVAPPRAERLAPAPTRVGNKAILSSLVDDFKSKLEEYNTAKAAATTQGDTVTQLTKSAATAEAHLNSLRTRAFPIENQEAAIASAEKRLSSVQQKLQEAQGVAPLKPEDFDALKNDLNDLVDQMNYHVHTNPLPRNPDVGKLQKEIDTLRLEDRRLSSVRNLRGQKRDVIDQQRALLLDKQHTAMADLIEAMNPANRLTSVRKLLQTQWVKSTEQVIKAESAARIRSNIVTRLAASQPQSSLREVFNATLLSWHHLDYTLNNPDSIISAGLRLANSGKIMRQKIEAEILKELPEQYRGKGYLQDWIEHPETIPDDPKVQSVVDEIRAGLADAGAELTDKEIIQELVGEYFPHWTKGQQALVRAAVGFRGELPTSAPPTMPRILEEAKSAVPDEKAIGQYYQAITRIMANRHIRAAVRESFLEDGKTPMYISGALVPRGGVLPLEMTKGRLYKYRDTMGGWVESKTSDLLDRINAPVGQFRGDRVLEHFDTKAEAQAARVKFDVPTKIIKMPLAEEGTTRTVYSIVTKNKIDDALYAMRSFNNQYKKLAMRNPLYHGYNQLSAGRGAGLPVPILGPLVNITIGKILSDHPDALALASREMFLQPSRMIQDVAEDLIAANPADQELAEALDVYRKKGKRIGERLDHFLWDSIVRNQQIGIWYIMRQSLVQKGIAEADAGIAAGTLSSQIVGIQNPKLLQDWEKVLRDYILFAYSWNKKHVTIPAEAISSGLARKITPELSEKQAALVTGLARRYLLQYNLMAPLDLFMVQMLVNGTPPWANEDGRQWHMEWTNMHDWMFGSDGRRHYMKFPTMNFAAFYLDKAQVLSDEGPFGGAGQNLQNISMPGPSYLIWALMNNKNIKPEEAIGQGIALSNPWERNAFGPVARAFAKKSQGTGTDVETLLSPLGLLTGIRTYQGPHRPFTITPRELSEQRAVDLELALHMSVDPLDATPEQRAEAEKRLSGETLFGTGFDLGKIGAAAAGAPVGAGGATGRLQGELDQLIVDAMIEQGVPEKKITASKRTGDKLFDLLTPTQKALMFAAHPELQYALNSIHTDINKKDRDAKDARTEFFHSLRKITDRAHQRQQEIDTALANGKITAAEWRTQHKDIGADEHSEIRGLQEGIQPSVYDPNAKDPTATPEEKAYVDYHAISLDDPKYQKDDFTQNIKLWQDDRNAYLAGLTQGQVEYIQNRDNQNRTDTTKEYENAASTYGKFLNDHSWLQQQSSFAMNLTASQRRIYLEIHPEITAYFKLRDNWWRANPDVAKFYHPLDEDQWKTWEPDKQAVQLASWVIDYRIGHPEYLTDWQRSVVENDKLRAEVIKGWQQAQYELYYSYLDQDYADYHGGSSRSGSKFAAYGGSKNYYRHYNNMPIDKQPNIFGNQPAGPPGGQNQNIFG